MGSSYYVTENMMRRDGERGRPRKITNKAEFVKAYYEANTMRELADMMQLCLTTTYKYARAFKLRTERKETRKLKELTVLRMMKQYRGRMNTRRLADLYNVSQHHVNKSLERAIEAYWKTPRKFPKPPTIPLVKVYHLLCEDESLWNHPEQLAKMTKIKLEVVEEYLLRCARYVAHNDIDNLPE